MYPIFFFGVVLLPAIVAGVIEVENTSNPVSKYKTQLKRKVDANKNKTPNVTLLTSINITRRKLAKLAKSKKVLLALHNQKKQSRNLAHNCWNWGKCEGCGPGEYHNYVCHNCPSGKYNNENNKAGSGGENACKLCPAGQYQGQEGQRVCVACGTGRYNGNSGRNSNCDVCTAGKYQANTGQSSCTNCGLGRYNPSNGRSSNCYVCTAGKYQANTGQSSCTDCRNGKYTSQTGRPSCTACTAGKYQVEWGQTSCNWCISGKYTSETEQSSCKVCPTGYHQSATPSETYTLCTACSAGRWNPYPAKTSSTDCYSCPPGWYQDNTGANNCKVCPSGYYQYQYAQDSLSDCKACDVGERAKTRTSTSCIPCTSGKFQDQTTNSNYECSFCVAGKEFTTLTTSCEECAVGKYQAENNAPSVVCAFCVAGQAFVSTSTNCEACASGKYQDQNTAVSVVCKFCATGTEFDAASLNCKGCISGKYQDKNTVAAVTCKNCPKGKQFHTLSTTCTNCHSDKYQDKNDVPSVGCEYCPAGFTHVDVSSACIECPSGRYQAENSASPAPKTCKTCPLGYGRPVSDDSANPCLSCANGQYQNEVASNGVRCKTCEVEDTYAPDRFSLCTSCATGKYRQFDSICSTCNIYSCTFCQAGKEYHVANNLGIARCTECPVGKYQSSSTTATVACEFCVAGKQYTSASTVCTECDGGTYQNENDRQGAVCKDCPGGFVQSVTGSDLCNPCDTGKFQPTSGQTSCSSCSEGQAADAKDAAACKICVSGQYQDASPSIVYECKNCYPGQYSIKEPGLMLTECIDCKVGMHAATEGQSACNNCSLQKYQPFTGKDTCYSCPTNRLPDGFAGNDRCSGCNPGESLDPNDSSKCLTCPNGWFAEVPNVQACSVCPAGWHGSQTKANCVACARGKYGDQEGELTHTDCIACVQGRYSSVVGYHRKGVPSDLRCTACEVGKYMDQPIAEGATKASDCLNCASGRYSSASAAISDTTCIECPVGTYGQDVGSSDPVDCQGCDAGKMQSEPGKSYCLPCEPGKSQPSTHQRQCIACKADTFNDQPGEEQCKECPIGRFAEIGSFSCSVCGTGTEQNGTGFYTFTCQICVAGKKAEQAGSLCTSCDPGMYQNEPAKGKCKQCVEGKYSAEKGAASESKCKQCIEGKYLSSKGAGSDTSCIDCPPGRAGNTRGASHSSFCVECISGFFSSSGGETVCTRCSLGKFQSKTGSASCQTCVAGKFGGEGPACSDCAKGQYRSGDTVDADTCTSCPAGWSQDEKGKAGCLPCNPGQFQPDSAKETCNACVVGQYSDATKQTTCKRCSLGWYTLSDNAVTCQPCPGGQFGQGCERCPSGWFREGGSAEGATGAESCDKCGVGFYANNMGQAACLPCVPGTFTQSTGGSICQLCPSGWFSDNSESIACTRCPVGKRSLNGSDVCQLCSAGEYGATCDRCPVGQYRAGDDTNATLCDDCPTGWSQNQKGQAACLRCSPGRYQDNVGGGICTECRTGRYVPNSASTRCYDCLSGRFAKIRGSVTCSTCNSGRVKLSRMDYVAQATINFNFSNATELNKMNSSNHLYIDNEPMHSDSAIDNDSNANKSEIQTPYIHNGNDQNSTEHPDDFLCTDCTPGKWAQAGDDQCTDCGSGLYQSNYRQDACAPCGAGMWSNKLGAWSNVTCTPCEAGYYSTVEGASDVTTCNACPPGKHGNVTGAKTPFACVDCPINAMSLESSIDCQDCISGKFTVNKSSTSCLNCIPGKYGNGSSCTKCPQGWHREEDDGDFSDDDLLECVQCPSGTTTSKEGAFSCDTCDIGTHGTIFGQCVECEPGQYQDARGKTSCLICKDGKIPNNRSTACQKPEWTIPKDCKTQDEYLDDATENKLEWECKPCPIGAGCNEKSSLFAKNPQSERLYPKRGYWIVPEEYIPNIRQPFVECTFPDNCLFNATSNITCHNHTKGTLCSTCAMGHHREEKICKKCRHAEVPIRVTLLVCLGIVSGILVYFGRKRMQRMHAKYGAAWRDAALAVKILISFAQIQQSLPWTLSSFVFPSSYQRFLNQMGVVNIDFLSLIGISCVVDMDYRYGVFMAFAIPIFIVVSCWIAFRIGKTQILTKKNLTLTNKEKMQVMGEVFDIADFDESGAIDEAEFRYLVRHIAKTKRHRKEEEKVTGKVPNQKKISNEYIHEVMIKAGAHMEKISPTKTILLISKENFLNAMQREKEQDEQDGAMVQVTDLISYHHAYKWKKITRLSSIWLSGAMQLMMLFHAPVSARAFYYFDCHLLGERSFLRRDYQIECWKDEWVAFLPFAVVLLFGFALAVPLGLFGVIFYNRKHLYAPHTRQTIGFLYARFVPGAEWWEIHEVVRKMTLCGLLVYLPSTSRAAAAVLVCIFALVTLNYTQPYKNSFLFWLSQSAFMLTACKYLVVIFVKAAGLDMSNSDDDALFGACLIFFDVMVVLMVVFCVVAILLKLHLDIQDLKKTGRINSFYDEETEYMISQIKAMTKKGRNNRRSSLILTRAHEMLTNADVEEDNVKTNQRKVGWGVLNNDALEKVITHGTAEHLEEDAQHARDLTMAALKLREMEARQRTKKRLQKRTLEYQIKIKEQNDLIEPLRLWLARRLSSKNNNQLVSWMQKIDTNKNNQLSTQEINALILACAKSATGKNIVLDFGRARNNDPAKDVATLAKELALQVFTCISHVEKNEVSYQELREWLFPTGVQKHEVITAMGGTKVRPTPAKPAKPAKPAMSGVSVATKKVGGAEGSSKGLSKIRLTSVVPKKSASKKGRKSAGKKAGKKGRKKGSGATSDGGVVKANGKGNVGAKVKLKGRKGGKSKAKKAALVAVNGKVKEQKVTKAASGLSTTPKQQALELTFHPSPNGQ